MSETTAEVEYYVNENDGGVWIKPNTGDEIEMDECEIVRELTHLRAAAAAAAAAEREKSLFDGAAAIVDAVEAETERCVGIAVDHEESPCDPSCACGSEIAAEIRQKPDAREKEK